jgi:hypothetical protein
MRWYGEEGGEEFSIKFHLGGEEMFVADSVVDALEVLLLLEAAPDGEAIVELVAGEFHLPAMVVVLEEADEVARGEPGIVEDFEGALGREVTGLVVEAGGFLRTRRRRGRGGVLLAAPLEDVGAVEAPDGHAGGFDAVVLAEVGALLPAVAGAGRRVIEEEEEFVEEGDGPAIAILGVLESVMQRFEPRDLERSCDRLVFAGFGRGIKTWRNHKDAILRETA